MKDPYKVLGLNPLATPSEVKSAWKQSVLRNHPDKGGDATAFIAVNKAYEEILAQNEKASAPYNYYNWTPKTNTTPTPTPKPTSKKAKTPYLFTLKLLLLATLLPVLANLLATPGYLLTDTAQPALSVNSINDILSMTLPFLLVAYFLRNKVYSLYIKYPKSVSLSYLTLVILQPLDPTIFTEERIITLITAVLTAALLLGYYLFKIKLKTQ